MKEDKVDSPLCGNDAGGAPRRKEPRWVVAFLRALERTGEVRAAAVDAGIDFSTAYARRRAHSEFGERWDAALRAHAEAKAEGEAEEIAALRLRSGQALERDPPSALRAATSPANAGEETTVSGGKVRRVGNGRWTKAKEAIFFEELAATSNVRMAAEAAGVSSTAVFARRLRHPVFAAKWNAVLRTARASADFYLVEEMHKAFNPESVETADAKPRMTIDQAIKISQLNARNAKDMSNPFAEKAESMTGVEVEALRERLLKKLERLVVRERRKALDEGWSYDERHDVMVPPGYQPPQE